MEFVIYIQSRGLGPKFDYTWVRVPSKDKEQKVKEPFVLKKLGDMIEGESLVLGRYENILVLLLTELATKDRKDYQNRRICNTLLCLAKDTEEHETILRGLAGSFLTDKSRIEAAVDQCVQSDSEQEAGFKVSEELPKGLLDFQAEDNKQATSWKKKDIDQNTKETREKLAGELMNYQLPKMPDVPLVVVTQYKSPAIFEQRKVWRGLGAMVKKNAEIHQQQKKTMPKSRPKRRVWFGLVAAVVIITLFLIRDRSEPYVTNFAISFENASVVEMSLSDDTSQPITIPRLGDNMEISLQFNETLDSKKQPQLSLLQDAEFLNQQQDYSCNLKNLQVWECSVDISNNVPNQPLDIGLTIQDVQDKAGNSMEPASFALQIESLDMGVTVEDAVDIFHRADQNVASAQLRITGKYQITDVWVNETPAIQSQQENYWKAEFPLQDIREPILVRVKDVYGNVFETHLF